MGESPFKEERKPRALQIAGTDKGELLISVSDLYCVHLIEDPTINTNHLRKLVTFRFLRKSHSQRDVLVTKTSLEVSVAFRSAG